MQNARELWRELIGYPTDYAFEHRLTLKKTYSFYTYYVELYEQANGPDTTQRLMIAFPNNATGPVPCVAVPFYFPEAMLGFDPETGEPRTEYAAIAMMRHLAERGYAAATADCYHLTYIKTDDSVPSFSKWRIAALALNSEQPNWSGIGKLVADTSLVIDALAADSRVDPSRIGIAGHSLGGKMAFYAGCLDERVKVILASDFGIGWEQTNWQDIWYWGDKVEELKARGIDHSSLLGLFAPKPMMILAGEYDNLESFELMKKAPGYCGFEKNLRIVNHATGHRPPLSVLEEGYRFLDEYLKE